jgi:hypothetical protein
MWVPRWLVSFDVSRWLGLRWPWDMLAAGSRRGQGCAVSLRAGSGRAEREAGMLSAVLKNWAQKDAEARHGEIGGGGGGLGSGASGHGQIWIAVTAGSSFAYAQSIIPFTSP